MRSAKQRVSGESTDVLSFFLSFLFVSPERGRADLVLGVCRSKSWGIQLEADGVGGSDMCFTGVLALL